MATVQGNKTSGESKSSTASKGKSATKEVSGERDENYNLISVLYHALQGAETAAEYLRDAQESGDEDLVQFFEETRLEQSERAAEAKQLLAERITDDSDEEDEDDED
jgi:hypothetical protein